MYVSDLIIDVGELLGSAKNNGLYRARDIRAEIPEMGVLKLDTSCENQ